jgi:predicted alpha/beta hydrolase
MKEILMTVEPATIGDVRMVDLELRAADGYRLGATEVLPHDPHAQIVVAGATAVPQGFYRRFAEFAGTRGYRTLTLDYRGVGKSAPAQLRGFRMDYRDWGRLDLAAAIEHCDPGLPLYLVGHSYGGHAIGLLPNHARIRSAYVFGTGAGWHGWMPPLERLRVLALWRLIGPPLVRWKGYLPFRMLGMGEDLPIDVFYQWRRWCGFPHYFFDDPDIVGLREQFAQVRTPIVLANALDDPWAPPRSRDALMTGYPNSDWRGIDLDPSVSGIGPIGHMGYFRAKAEPLWQVMLDTFGVSTPVATSLATSRVA